MKRIVIISILLFTVLFSFSQQQNRVSYEQLKEYQGIYEYPNHIKVSFAASPKDTALVAIINQSEYILKNESPDVFSTKYDTVSFFRDAHNVPAGYVSKKDTFKLISKDVFFSEAMWYPRPKGKDFYQYTIPENINDGLTVGDINKTILDTALLKEMMQKIINSTYPDVHSVLIIKDGKLVFEQYFINTQKTVCRKCVPLQKVFFSAYRNCP